MYPSVPPDLRGTKQLHKLTLRECERRVTVKADLWKLKSRWCSTPKSGETSYIPVDSEEICGMPLVSLVT